jgi:hypothetical protein
MNMHKWIRNKYIMCSECLILVCRRSWREFEAREVRRVQTELNQLWIMDLRTRCLEGLEDSPPDTVGKYW